MIFYLGTGKCRWMERVPETVPLFISANQLQRYRRHDEMPRGLDWALDSGGFTELKDHGAWRMGPDEYGSLVTRLVMDCGWPPAWCAPQDWMCEEAVIKGGRFKGGTFVGTGLSVEVHQELTVDNLVWLRREFDFINWIPVLQGDTVAAYRRCIRLYDEAGIDLSQEPLVGLGSVCRREATAEIEAIVRDVHAHGIHNLHGFGVKTSGLRRYGHLLTSADSQAWSYAARKRRLRLSDDCPHPGDCRNCLTWAQEWRRRALAGVNDTGSWQLDLFGKAA